MEVDKPLILDVGSGAESVAARMFEGTTVVRLDADKELDPDYVHDITQPLPPDLHNKFDMVFLSHVLEHLPFRQVTPVLKNLMEALKPGTGEIWVIVPALEWAAKEIAKDKPSPVLIWFLYGSQDNDYQFHKCGFTLYQLRAMMEYAGYVTRQAYQTQFALQFEHEGELKALPALQNIVVGLRSE